MRSLIKKILLQEGRVEDAKSKYPNNGDLVDFFVSSDPSGNNKYLQWMLKQVIDKNENRDLVLSLVSKFHKNYQRLEKKDINQYKTVGDLLTVLSSLKQSKGEEKREIKREGARVLYEDENVMVLRPLNHKASCTYGAGTKWCITSKSTDSYWKSYTKETSSFAGTDWYESEWVEERVEPNFIQRLMGQEPKVVKKEVKKFVEQFPRNIIYFVIFKRRISDYKWDEELRARIPNYVPADPKNPMNKLAFLYKPDRADFGDLSWSRWYRGVDFFEMTGDMLDAAHNNLSIFNAEDKKVTLREISKEFDGDFGYILAHLEEDFKKEQNKILGHLRDVLDKVFPLLGAEGSKKPISWITGDRGGLNYVPSDNLTKGKNARGGKMVSFRNSRDYKHGHD
jgi:hypothetical protein